MLDRGGEIADRLEKAVRAGRDAGARAGSAEATPSVGKPTDSNRVSFPSRIERELRRVVEARR
jgi:hypothetical protein